MRAQRDSRRRSLRGENIQKSAAEGIDRRKLLLPQVVAASY